MSLKPSAIPSVPAMTSQVAHAAFPKGNPYLTLRDELGAIFDDTETVSGPIFMHYLWANAHGDSLGNRFPSLCGE